MWWGALFRLLVVLLCAWEIAAIGSGRIPTLTSLSHQARNHIFGVTIIIACLVFLAWHLLVEGD